MKEFILIFRNARMDFTPTSEQIQVVEKQWGDWMGSIAAQGLYVGGTRPAEEGKTILPGNVITDGPYAEVKEILMGTVNVKANTIDDAVEIGKGCPILQFGGTVEVRPVMIMNM